MNAQTYNTRSKAPITVLISFHNNQGFLDNLLRSILESNHEDWLETVIIIDSNSDVPPCLPISESLTIKSIYNSIGSLTSSLNLGLSMVTTEWACILDCDTEIIDPNFWSIIDCATDNKLPLVIPASLYRNNDLQDCFDQIDTVLLGYIFSKKFLKPFLKSYNNMKISMLNSCKPFDVSYFWNQCVFINKTVYTQFRYSELLYVWACDFELSKRLHRSGQRLVCLPNFKIKHYGEGSSKHDSLNRILGVLKGEFTYTSIAYPIIAPILHVLAIAARAGRLMVHMLKLENRQKVNFEKLLFKSHVKLLFRQPCDFHLK